MGGRVSTDAGLWVALSGGPPGMTRLHRLTHGAAAVPSEITVPFYGRHQHFVRTEATEPAGEQTVPVFRFVYSTAIAE